MSIDGDLLYLLIFLGAIILPAFFNSGKEENNPKPQGKRIPQRKPQYSQPKSINPTLKDFPEKIERQTVFQGQIREAQPNKVIRPGVEKTFDRIPDILAYDFLGLEKPSANKKPEPKSAKYKNVGNADASDMPSKISDVLSGNPENLKTAFVLSEILSKPVALRDNKPPFI